jgi:parallel beta-helix repeat protein
MNVLMLRFWHFLGAKRRQLPKYSAPGDSLRSYTPTRDLTETIQIDSDGITLDGNGHTITGPGQYGVYLYGRTGVTIRNLIVSHFYTGIRLLSSNNNIITNNNASQNIYNGILLGYSSNNDLSGNIANNLDIIYGFGINLQYSNYNTLINNNASNSANGIVLGYSSNNDLSDNIAENNGIGIFLNSYSNNNILSGNNANSNTYGIRLTSASNNNLIGNNVKSNKQYGIYPIQDSYDNTIYNNYFNNTMNAYVSSINNNGYNAWNTTKTLGTNIVGGPYLGGNFWATPGGTGFSQTCTDADGDEICDSAYTLYGTGNKDYLPLTLGPTPTPTVDTTPPTIECGSADGLWHGTDVSITCTTSDSGGLANPDDSSFSLSTNVADNEETSNASTNSRNVCDMAGNCAMAGPINGNMVDKKAPSISILEPITSDTYTFNQAIAASYSCSDGGSGVAICVGTVADGANFDTSTLGTKSFEVTATDNAGNSKSQSLTYEVNYNFIGFSSPVDNPSIMNIARAGQAIPLKWQLLNANNVPVTNLASVTVTAASLSCSLGTSNDLIEEYATGSIGLQNLGNGYYQFNWKTPTTYANSCKTLNLNIGDGTPRTALFQFTK